MGQLHFECLPLMLPLFSYSCATCLLARRRRRRCPPCPAGPGVYRTPGWSPASLQSPGRRSGWCGRDAVWQRGRKPVTTPSSRERHQRELLHSLILDDTLWMIKFNSFHTKVCSVIFTWISTVYRFKIGGSRGRVLREVWHLLVCPTFLSHQPYFLHSNSVHAAFDCDFAAFYRKCISSTWTKVSTLTGKHESWMQNCNCLERWHSVVEILTAIVTTVRSAKAVITTFCRMLSCGDISRERWSWLWQTPVL